MKNNKLTKLLLLLAITIMLLGIVNATKINDSKIENTKIVKTTKDPIIVKTENLEKKINTDNNTITNKKLKDNSSKKQINKNSINNQTKKEKTYSGHVDVTVASKVVYNKKTNIVVKLYGFNPYTDTGYVYLYLDDHLIDSKKASKTTKFGVTFADYGTCKYEVDYYGYGGTAIDTGEIKIKPRYSMTLTAPSTVNPNQKIKATVKILDKNTRISSGTVRIKLNGKTISTKHFKNGLLTITYKMPNNSGNYKLKMEYLKNNKVMKSVTKNIKIKYHKKVGKTIFGEKIIVRHNWFGEPDYEYLGTHRNIYIHERTTGNIFKRVLVRNGGYYKYILFKKYN